MGRDREHGPAPGPRASLAGGFNAEDDGGEGDESSPKASRKERKAELEEMTVQELKEKAEADEVDLAGAKTKDEIVKRLLKD